MLNPRCAVGVTLVPAIYACPPPYASPLAGERREGDNKTWMPATSARMMMVRPHRNALKNRQPASVRGPTGSNLSGDVFDISICPNGPMPLKKFFRAGTAGDD